MHNHNIDEKYYHLGCKGCVDDVLLIEEDLRGYKLSETEKRSRHDLENNIMNLISEINGTN